MRKLASKRNLFEIRFANNETGAKHLKCLLLAKTVIVKKNYNDRLLLEYIDASLLAKRPFFLSEIMIIVTQRKSPRKS